MVVDPLTSSDSFIKALKASSDPPIPSGALKIELATQAWKARSFYLPSKSVLITEWILSRFLKEKGRDSRTNPLFDERHWTLLFNILSENGTSPPSATGISKSAALWLTPLLNRTPAFPVLSTLIRNMHNLSLAVLSQSLKVFRIISPLALPKANYDVLFECFCETIAAFNKEPPTLIDTDTERERHDLSSSLALIVLDAFEMTFSEYSNKKKTYTTFVENNLQDWIQCRSNLFRHVSLRNLGVRVTAVGSAVLFSSDVLRNQLGPTDLHTKASSSSKFPSFLQQIKLPPSQPASFRSTLDILPSLLCSFVECVRKYRTLIFQAGQAESRISPKSQIKQVGMDFLLLCFDFVETTERKTGSQDLVEHCWKAKFELFAVMEDEALYQSSDAKGRDFVASQAAIAVQLLGQSSREYVLAEAAIRFLSILARLDYDLVTSMIPAVLSALASFPSSIQSSALEFLDLQLSYHSKTRTLDKLMHMLVSTLAEASGESQTYSIISKGPVLSAKYQDQLNLAVSTFLTPSQTSSVVDMLLDALSTIWGEHQSHATLPSNSQDGAGPPKKKRRLSVNIHPFAARFALITHFVVGTMRSLPMKALSADIIQNLAERVAQLKDDLVRPAIRALTVLGNGKQQPGANQDEIELVGIAMFKLAYASQTAGSIWEAIPNRPFDDLKEIGANLATIFESPHVLPELAVEIARTFLQHFHTVRFPLLKTPIFFFDALIKRLDISFEVAMQTTWTGSLADLNKGEPSIAIALWDLVLDRWLPILDAYGTSSQITRVVDLLLRYNTDIRPAIASESPSLTLPVIVRRTLSSALLWECTNIRTALLAAMETRTVVLQQIDMDRDLQLLENGDLPLEGSFEISEAIGAFRVILALPVDYLTRSARMEFVRRALAAEVYLACAALSASTGSRKKGRKLGLNKSHGSTHTLEERILLRTFVLRVAQDTGGIDTLSSNIPLITYLGSVKGAPENPSDLFTRITLKLLDIAYNGAIKSLHRGNAKVVGSILSSFSHLLSMASEVPVDRLDLQCLLLLFRTISESIEIVQIPLDQQHQMRELSASIFGYLRSTLLALGSSETQTSPAKTSLVQAFCIILHFNRWLGIIAPTQNMLTGYIALRRMLGMSEYDETDAILIKYSKASSADEYDFALDSIYSTMASTSQPIQLVAAIQLSDVLMRNSPEGAHKVAQKHTTQCLQDLARFEIHTQQLSLQTLRFILHQCTERPFSLRTVDIGCIFVILGNILSGAISHDDGTTGAIYEHIVSIATALVRQRRDLVVTSLPHLSAILSRLLEILRTVRLDLGARQRRSVTDTLPSWINPALPLGTDNAKSLARLLTSLTTKSVVRVLPSRADPTGKAQSLTQPFSKHAPYVLTAYLRALSDPLCQFLPSIRRELEPGLFALCDMMGEHGRDSIMAAMLDGGGRTMLKILWKEYEKQRYTGKG